jgi:hypothetical protein
VGDKENLKTLMLLDAVGKDPDVVSELGEIAQILLVRGEERKQDPSKVNGSGDVQAVPAKNIWTPPSLFSGKM